MPRKHTTENRFRFQSFTDRIGAIRIGANVKIKRFDTIPDDAETFLGENLRRWATINCSSEYDVFERQLSPLCESLPLVYLHRQKIASLFQNHLATSTKLSQETILDLLVHFARDLSSEFVPFAQDFVRLLVEISLKNKKDPDVLEWSFSCLAHLMKLLWKFFVEHLELFLDILLPTFESNLPAYIRQFSAEAFAFLVRKSSDLLGTIRHIVDNKLRSNSACGYGFALVIFEVVRGANKTLLPCTEEVVRLLIELCREEEIDSPHIELFQIFLNSCAEHIAVQSSGVVFKVLLAHLQSTASANSCKSVANAQAFFTTWLAYRRGVFCCDANAIAKAIVDSMAWHHSHSSCVENLLSIFSTLISLENNTLPAMQCYVHVKTLFELPIPKAKLFDFALEHVSSPLFLSSFLPHILNVLLKFKEKEAITSEKMTESYDFCDGIEGENEENREKEEEEDFVQESLLTILAKLVLQKHESSENVTLPDVIVKKLAKIVDNFLLPQIWSIAVISKHFKLLESKRECANLLSDSFGKFCSFAKTKLNSTDKEDKNLIRQVFIAYNEVASSFSSFGKTAFEKRTFLSLEEALSLLGTFPNNLLALNLAKTVVDICVDDDFQKCLEESEKLYSALAGLLECNLASPVPELRESSLHILERASRGIYSAYAASIVSSSSEDEQSKRKCGINVLSTLLNAERTVADLRNFKDRLNLLQKIRADIVGNQPALINWQRLCVFSLIGQLSIDFTALHKPICELLTNYSENIPRENFWNVFSKIFQEIYEKTLVNSCEIEEEGVKFHLAKSCSDLLLVTSNDFSKKSRYSNWHTFHVRLWEALRNFRVEDLEASSRHYVPIFLNFVSTSFSNIMSSATLPLVNLVVAPASEKRLKRIQSTTFGERRHCLVAMLSVFSKLRHRSQLSSAEKIISAVFRLLKLPRPELQTPALEFLLNTNWPGIGVYKELLTNLLEPKRYRSSLVEFGDLSSLTENDRKSVLPVLLRLIFGQMHFSKNKKRSGKSGFAKKSASLAFLANISSSEIALFVEIMLEPFSASEKWFKHAFSNDDKTDFVALALEDGVDPVEFPSTELQFWFFHTFTDSVSNLHNVAAEQWRPIFRIALILYALTTKILANSTQKLDSQHEKRLKRLRKLAFKSFGAFFMRSSAALSSESVEISSFFDHVVWPEFDRCEKNGSDLLPLLSLATIFASDSALRSPLLLRENPADKKTLLAKIFDSLIVNSVGDLKIIDSYLKFFETLLPAQFDEDEEGEEEDERSFKEAVYAKRSVIISLVSNILASSKKNKLFRNRVPKTLAIFQRVTAKVDDPHCASDVFQLLLSMLSSNSLPVGESQSSALKSVLEVVPTLESVSQSQMITVALCFSRVTDRESRAQLCTLLEEIAKKFAKECEKISGIVRKLNAWSQKDLNEPDYELRLSAFSESLRLLEKDSEEGLSPLDVTFLLNNCLFFLLIVDDFSIRANSSELIVAVIKWAGKGETSSGRKTVANSIISATSRGIQHKNELVRSEFLRVLAQLVRTFPEHPALVGLSQLIDDNDADADFFENMRHVQHHRRARAMRRLGNLLSNQETSKIGLRPLTSFLMPLAQMYLVTAIEGGAKMRITLVDASLELLRACCRHLPWPTYHRLLSRFLAQLISGNSEKISFNIRAVVAILDAYHFVSFANESSEVNSDPEPLKPIAPRQKDEKPDSDNSVLRAVQGQIVPNIVEAINGQLLPGSLASGQCAVIPLTIAAIRLLIHTPATYRIAALPSIILKIVEFLKSRFLEVRVTARKSLCQICLALGPSQFGWIVRDLRIGLPRGYQRHVLTYTVGELVRTVQPSFQPGQLDSCIKELTSIFCSELFTVLSEEKEAECKVAGKWPEARRRASLHAYPVLANLVSRVSIDTYLQPLYDVLLTTTDGEKVRKARQILHLVVPILAQNPGISISDLVSLARRWLQGAKTSKNDSKNQEEEPSSSGGLLEPRPQPSQLLPPKPSRMGLAAPVTMSTANSYVISEFGLRLLFSLIKHNRLTDSTVPDAFSGDEAQLEAFSSEVHSLMKLGENEAVLHAALQLAYSLLTFKVPAFTSRLNSIADSVFELLKAELLQKNTQSRLLVSCFKAAGILVELARSDVVAQRKNRVGLDSEQIDALLVCIDEALLGDRQGVCALQLLKKLLDSSLKSLQLAEIINGTVTKVALRGRDDHQPLARACILSYMLHYPIGQKSLESMLDTFISILALENAETCVVKSSVEMLFLIASHYPEKELERCSALIFLPVAALFVNSHDVDVRELVNVVLVRLLSRVSQTRRDAIFQEMVQPWLISGKMLREQLAGYAVASFVEAEDVHFESRLANVMPALVDLIEEKIKNSTKIPEKEDEDEENQTKIPDNEAPIDDSLDGLIYSLVSSLVKLVRQFHLTSIAACSGGFPQLIRIAKSLSLHPHSWIRCQIGYLWFELFQSVEVNDFLQASGLGSGTDHQLKTLCRRIVNQLLTQGISPEFGEKVALNCVFLSRVLLKTGNLVLLTWFCRRVVRIAMAESIYEAKMSCTKRLCVFKWMAAFASDFANSKMSKLESGVDDLVSSLVVPLARELKEGPSYNTTSAGDDEEGAKKGEGNNEIVFVEDPISQELKPVCLELAEVFRKTFGVEVFTAAWNSAVKKAAERKMKRNAERAGLAITDPARAARLKVFRQASKREAKKRRIGQDKMGRGAASSNQKKSKRFDGEAE